VEGESSHPCGGLFALKNMSVKNTNQWLKFLLPISGIILLLGILPLFPYAYYQILRWITTITAILLVFKYVPERKNVLSAISLAIAIFFNPISPIFLSRGIWITIDFLVAIFFLILKKESEHT
jgi:predicted membrane protein